MYKRIALEVQYECQIPPFYLYHSCSSCVNCQNPFEVRSTIKTPEGFVLMYISLYSFKIIALLLSMPLLTSSELLRLTLRWLTRATPSSAACVYESFHALPCPCLAHLSSLPHWIVSGILLPPTCRHSPSLPTISHARAFEHVQHNSLLMGSHRFMAWIISPPFHLLLSYTASILSSPLPHVTTGRLRASTSMQLISTVS